MSTTKTPSKQYKSARSQPGTPAGRAALEGMGMGNGNMSVGGDSTMFGGGGGKGDMTNPFITKPPSTSPINRSLSRAGSSTSLHSNAIRAGMGIGAGSMDIVGERERERDVRGSGVGESEREKERERGMRYSSGRNLDRFIPTRPASANSSHRDDDTGTYSLPGSNLGLDDNTDFLTTSSSTSFANTSQSSSSAPPDPSQPHQRILSFTSAPPAPSSHNPHASSHLHLSRQYASRATPNSKNGNNNNALGATGSKMRKFPTAPERVLDSPGFLDDYYLNLVAWSSANMVAVALGVTVYIWNADNGEVQALHPDANDTNEPCLITSVSWASDGSYLAVGKDDGVVELWDVDTGKKIRSMGGHLARVPVLSWHTSTVSSGCRDGSIWHHDVRVAQHKVGVLQGHVSEVCGLAWRSDGQFLASGGNDNVVNCWDGRNNMSVIADQANQPVTTPKWQKMNHMAAVKAIAWCPWQNSLLATGGGTNDSTIHFWSSTTGARLSSLPTKSQVTSLIWSHHSKEIISTHGYPEQSWALWSYPGLQKVHEVVGAHDSRVLASAISPDGCMVVTGAGDESLKFWKIWEPKSISKVKAAEREEMGGSKIKSSVSMWR